MSEPIRRHEPGEAHAQLTRGQVAMFAAAVLLMAGAGAAGAYGTYTNTVTEFGRVGTALGVVAAGEGVTLIVALVMVGLTMLGQSAPLAVRTGLWAAPVAAAVIGVAVADDLTEAVVYGLSPMGMSAAAEGIGLLARRIVVYRTGVDAETQRRNAETVQRLAYHRARAANHPSEKARKRSEAASWRLAKAVGVGDHLLGARLVEVQRDRLRDGADAALLDMFTAPTTPQLPAVEQVPAPAEVPAPEPITAPKVDLPKTDVVVTRLDFDDFEWKPAQLAPVAAAVAAEEPKSVVTAPVDLTPSELRRKARRLHQRLVTENGRGITIDRLREEYGLSRRDATELRRELVTEDGAK